MVDQGSMRRKLDAAVAAYAAWKTAQHDDDVPGREADALEARARKALSAIAVDGVWAEEVHEAMELYEAAELPEVLERCDIVLANEFHVYCENKFLGRYATLAEAEEALSRYEEGA